MIVSEDRESYTEQSDSESGDSGETLCLSELSDTEEDPSAAFRVPTQQQLDIELESVRGILRGDTNKPYWTGEVNSVPAKVLLDTYGSRNYITCDLATQFWRQKQGSVADQCI